MEIQTFLTPAPRTASDLMRDIPAIDKSTGMGVMDGQTDGRMDRPSCRDARIHQKRKRNCAVNRLRLIVNTLN